MAFKPSGKSVVARSQAIDAPNDSGTPTVPQILQPLIPSLPRRMANFGKAVARSVAAGCPTRNPDEVAAILAICEGNSCGMYRAEKGVCGHRNCGCRLRRKIKLATEHCPLGLW